MQCKLIVKNKCTININFYCQYKLTDNINKLPVQCYNKLTVNTKSSYNLTYNTNNFNTNILLIQTCH